MSYEGGALPPWQRSDNFGLNAHNRLVGRVNSISAISPAGGEMEVMGSPSGMGLINKNLLYPARPVRVRVNTTIAAGRYNAKRYSSDAAYLATGSFTAAERGTVAGSDDCIVIDPESSGLADADALPLIGLETSGFQVGTDPASGKPIIEIPPPGVRAMQYNTTTHKLQVAYVSSPASDQWVDMVTYTACP